ncbi:MAG TPA: S41 family peptidase [Phycisphaerales bacterium]|nr:S41 family peptidase [Phycisphaerales bacterium]
MTTRSLSYAACLSLLAGLAAPVSAQNNQPKQDEPVGAMLRLPDVSKDRICFVYANDIWTAPKAGGEATPLASPPGTESFPRFSPDGKSIAFVGNYDGGRDLYTLPLSGGLPTRVSHHPGGETLSDWTADGKLIYLMSGMAGLGRQSQLFTVGSTGGLPERLPVPYAGFGSISPDGTWLAYTPHSTDTRTWKRYRGGMATDIWLFSLKDKSSKKITDWEGTDTIPMWVPRSEDGKRNGSTDVVYYLSDAGPEHRLNVWSYDVKSGKKEQITKYTDNDVRWPSIGPGDGGKGEIVYQLGSELRLLDLGSKKDRAIKVTIPGAKPMIKPRLVDASKNITSASISPTGKRVVIEGRGDVWSAPAKEGVTRNMTRSDGVFERSPAWSPDGKWIAYLSDESGEYELYIRPSDGRTAAEKKADKDAGDEAEKVEPSALTRNGEPRKLTSFGAGFRFNPTWSPDSKHIVLTDRAGKAFLVEVTTEGEPKEVKEIDQDPVGERLNPTWSHDSNWLVYSRGDEESRLSCIWVYNVKSGEKTRLTSPMFSSQNPAFDRKGDYLYFTSNRAIENPTYADIDTTFAYTGTELLYVVPLRDSMKSPFLPKSDEEEYKKDEPKKDEKKEDKKDENGDAEKKDNGKDEKEDKPSEKAAAPDDGVSGTWEGKATGGGEGFPPEGIAFSMKVTLHADGKVTGSVTSQMGTGNGEGTFDKGSGAFTLTFTVKEATITLTGTIKGEELSGDWSDAQGGVSGKWTCKRTAKGGEGGGKPEGDKAGDKAKDKEKKPLKIDLENFERRAIQVPVPAGAFGNLMVTHDGKLIYLKSSGRRGGETAIKIFDINSDEKDEKNVIAGGGGFELSADGKKLLLIRGSNIQVMDPVAGGGKPTTVPTSGMKTTINPRNEWKQILADVWRLNRDYFYEPTLHGVDWPKMREHYGKMVDDATSREDVNWIIAELISELNIGHAYVTSPGDVEQQPSLSVGMLGCDYELVKDGDKSAYKITKIHEGGAWDVDGRGPCSQPGVNIKEGEYLLAVNGVPVDTSKDPWAAFIDTADRATIVTIGKNPVIDDQSRDVLLKPMGGEQGLRTRAWIEKNRKYVEEKSGGKIGYIYVPNTGVDGQNELFRQFVGQRGKAALVIDERWNGGGQIPTRFIELLNRPVTNYWAIRDGKDWVWPPDSHQGPKAMLINGLAGSGGDAFPYYFKQAKIGKTIGTRTWGGLVGIQGYPGLIDGGGISVPSFAFYKLDGTWGVEGHGVDPDIEVVDDPAKMTDGGDPQLDAAIAHLTEELKTKAFNPPKRPTSPNRAGMGIPPEQR